MTALTHWNPFKATPRFDPITSFEDMFRSLATRPQWRDLEAAPDMRIDVSEDDKAFHIKAEIPGVDKNDIELSVDGNQVSISAEVKREAKSKKDEAEIYTERYYGRVYRSFALPSEFDSAKAEARCDNGVLSLDLPKRPNGSARKIAVS